MRGGGGGGQCQATADTARFLCTLPLIAPIGPHVGRDLKCLHIQYSPSPSLWESRDAVLDLQAPMNTRMPSSTGDGHPPISVTISVTPQGCVLLLPWETLSPQAVAPPTLPLLELHSGKGTDRWHSSPSSHHRECLSVPCLAQHPLSLPPPCPSSFFVVYFFSYFPLVICLLAPSPHPSVTAPPPVPPLARKPHAMSNGGCLSHDAWRSATRAEIRLPWQAAAPACCQRRELPLQQRPPRNREGRWEALKGSSRFTCNTRSLHATVARCIWGSCNYPCIPLVLCPLPELISPHPGNGACSLGWETPT